MSVYHKYVTTEVNPDGLKIKDNQFTIQKDTHSENECWIITLANHYANRLQTHLWEPKEGSWQKTREKTYWNHKKDWSIIQQKRPEIRQSMDTQPKNILTIISADVMVKFNQPKWAHFVHSSASIEKGQRSTSECSCEAGKFKDAQVCRCTSNLGRCFGWLWPPD